MSDSLIDGSKPRVVSVIDDGNRQYLIFEIGRSLTLPRVTGAQHDFLTTKPKRLDNGPD
jgi:hypothetical protein